MTRRGRPPDPDKPMRRCTMALEARHAELIAEWAERLECKMGDALGILLDGLAEHIANLEVEDDGES